MLLITGLHRRLRQEVLSPRDDARTQLLLLGRISRASDLPRTGPRPRSRRLRRRGRDRRRDDCGFAQTRGPIGGSRRNGRSPSGHYRIHHREDQLHAGHDLSKINRGARRRDRGGLRDRERRCPCANQSVRGRGHRLRFRDKTQLRLRRVRARGRLHSQGGRSRPDCRARGFLCRRDRRASL